MEGIEWKLIYQAEKLMNIFNTLLNEHPVLMNEGVKKTKKKNQRKLTGEKKKVNKI